MDLKTKKKISLFGILAYFLILCAASVYAYLQVGKGEEVFFVSFITIFSMLIVPIYYFGKGKKEVKQKHKIVQILIMMVGGLILFFWQISYTPLFLVTNPATAFMWIWKSSTVCFFAGLILVIGTHHTDEIVEVFKQRKD